MDLPTLELPSIPAPRMARKIENLPDLDKVFGIVPEDKHNPLYGLMQRGGTGTWYVIYYDSKRASRYFNLHTEDPFVARRLRDKLYSRARSAGRGSSTKKEFYAEQILRDETIEKGIRFVVCYDGKVVWCDSLTEARTKRREIARQIIEDSNGYTPDERAALFRRSLQGSAKL